MKKFMDENFLLQSETAVRLYHDFAKNMPIIDYHCHLNPREIAENKKYRNITEILLGGDHYKWRAMRFNGIEEQYITGNAPDKDKFMKWAETMSYCIGNPLFHWTHLELKRFFGIDAVLSPETAEEIWDQCNEMLQKDEFTARSLIRRSNVKVLCTTDDPTDTLEYHDAIVGDKSFDVKVLPTFRPDKGINIEKPGFAEWLAKLSKVSEIDIRSLEELKTALSRRLEFFHSRGCRLSDHALEPVVYMESTDTEAAVILQKALTGADLGADEIMKYKTNIMVFLGSRYNKLGWAMQLHLSCLRNNNHRQFKLLGPDTGFDAIDDSSLAKPLSQLLDKINDVDSLPKTILYGLNPRDNELLSAMAGCFQGDGIPGKVQFGSGWWFNDQKDGMERQMTALAHTGLLSRFVGMLTDSRSFLSYTRHEYFRRILCNIIGQWAENGETPNDLSLLGKMVKDISYKNAEIYFNF